MKIKLDRLGRVMLPKKILESLGLSLGSILEIDIEDDAIQLRPVAEQSLLAEHSGVLVFEGVARGHMSEAVNKLRESRNCRIGGVERPSRPTSSLWRRRSGC